MASAALGVWSWRKRGDETRAATAVKFEGAIELLDQKSNKLKPHGGDLFRVETGRQTDAVIRYFEHAEVVGIAPKRDVDLSRALSRKGVLYSVGQKLVDYQPAGNSLVQIERNLVSIELHADLRGFEVVETRETVNHSSEINRKIDLG